MNFSPSFSPKAAYLLVIHGSRDPRPGEALQILAHQVECALEGNALIGVACLECAEQPLHQQIMAFSDRALCMGCRSIKIVPLFLLPGVHVREDIPEEVALAQRELGHALTLDILPYMGSYPGMVDLLDQRIQPLRDNDGESVDLETTPVILMAHGSRRAGGNQPIEAIATHLGATPAYWSVAPKLADQIQMLSSQGYKRIVVIPYFLFAGGITDAIAQSMAPMAMVYPNTTLILGDPLGPKSDLAALIAQEITQEIAQEIAQEMTQEMDQGIDPGIAQESGQSPQNLVTSNTLKY